MELSNNHWKVPDFAQRMTIKQWKNLLLQGKDEIMFRGYLTPLVAKSLGFGVVEVSKDLSNHPTCSHIPL